jgi:hypothetical protein
MISNDASARMTGLADSQRLQLMKRKAVPLR